MPDAPGRARAASGDETASPTAGLEGILGVETMRIIDRWMDLVHTHFVTDGVRLTERSTRDIERQFAAVLRASGIVFPMHFARAPRDRTIRIVLECQPVGEALDRLERELARILEPIPIRPPSIAGVRVEGE